jgi:hypothetical protein
MAPTSTFYFDANATAKKDFFRGIPMFAVHAGSGYENGWESGEVTGKGGFDFIAAKMNPQVLVRIAMPRTYAGRYFTKDREYSKVAIYAFKPVYGSASLNGGYMVGASIALVLKEVKVIDVVPILQWKGLPGMPQVQKNYLEKLIGRETYAPVAVTCFVMQGDVVA